MFLRPNQEGQLEISLPIPGNIKFPNFSVAETGEVVSEVLNQREKYLGKKIALTGDLISFDEITTAVSESNFICYHQMILRKLLIFIILQQN